MTNKQLIAQLLNSRDPDAPAEVFVRIDNAHYAIELVEKATVDGIPIIVIVMDGTDFIPEDAEIVRE